MTHISYKEKAIKLRQEGYSYNLIQEQVPVSKSTLSRWLKSVAYEPNQAVKERIGLARAQAGLRKHQDKQKSYEVAERLAQQDIKNMKDKKLYFMGLGLYAGEGEKNDTVGVINANPEIIVFTMKWLRECYGVGVQNFTLAIHTYPDVSETSCKSYWKTVTGIPLIQFGKTQVDTRNNKSKSKRGSLPYGTAHLRVKSNGKKELGVLLSRRIEAAINIVLKNKSRV
jgi:hypothetical protein